MYLPAIITTEQAFQPLPSRSDRFNLVLPLHSFSEGNPFLVHVAPYSDLSQLGLNTSEQDSSLLLDSTLSAQTDRHPLVFWNTLNSVERSGRWI